MEIDNTLLAGIMTSLATLVAAFITISSVKKANQNLEETDKYSIFNKTYTILVRESDNNTIVIKDGFSWVAFFFHIFWLFFSKLWEAIFTLLIIFGGIFVHLYIVEITANIGLLKYYVKFVDSAPPLFVLLLGTFGNGLLIRKYTHSFCLLDNRNYKVVDSVVATTKANALLKYMEKYNNG
ncbi:MAG: hypothetical protein CSB47_03550 [Proteobacteria bacterium]|nr:MAG: hypothetical protein CSB47_03550 [Pseudomonadota bacterium]